MVTGRGGRFLARKREYHRRRWALEKQVLEEAERNPESFRANRCPSCGRRDPGARRFHNPVGFEFAICPHDGTVYMDPVPAEETLRRLYNDPAESFKYLPERQPVDDLPAGDREDLDALLRMLGPVAGRRRLLDVGCATGGFIKSAAPLFDVEGVELNATTAAVARDQGLPVATGTVEDVPGSERFFLVTLLQVIEHLAEPGRALSEVGRLLAPGGFLYVATPNVDSASFRYLGPRHTHVASFGHVSLFTRAGLVALAERCGFDLVAHEFCSGRDLELHDAVSLKLAPGRFRHRMALYSPRLYYLSRLVDGLTFGVLARLLFPRGYESYQRALFRKREGSHPEVVDAGSDPT